ncbi:MAG: hypothetical protein RL294_1120 [Actinomycetota bacterium]
MAAVRLPEAVGAGSSRNRLIDVVDFDKITTMPMWNQYLFKPHSRERRDVVGGFLECRLDCVRDFRATETASSEVRI